MTPAERDRRFDFLSRSCIVCRLYHGVVTPASVHHLTGIKYRALGKKADDEHTIGLCHCHHQGEFGIHRIGMRAWETMFWTQVYLLEVTDRMFARLH
jgi:hypothetical protein